jgi:hypothetical protein
MAGAPTKESVKKYIEENCDVIAELYTVNVDRFVDGSLVKIYLHSYDRMSTFDDDGNIYVIKKHDIGNNFIEKEEWRIIQLNKILKK